jgi:hypothetical protein
MLKLLAAELEKVEAENVKLKRLLRRMRCAMPESRN